MAKELLVTLVLISGAVCEDSDTAPAYTPSVSEYEASKPGYNPAVSYPSQDLAYTAPEPSYRAPEPSYTAPEPSYTDPAVSYDPLTSEYGATDAALTSPEAAYEQTYSDYYNRQDDLQDLDPIPEVADLSSVLVGLIEENIQVFLITLAAVTVISLVDLDMVLPFFNPLSAAKIDVINMFLYPFNLGLAEITPTVQIAKGRSLPQGFTAAVDGARVDRVTRLLASANNKYEI